MSQKEFLKKDSFCFTIIAWTWACGVCSNILPLTRNEAGANPARSTPESLLIFFKGLFVLLTPTSQHTAGNEA